MGELALIAIIALAVLVQTNKNRPPFMPLVLWSAWICAAVAYDCCNKAKRVAAGNGGR